MILLIQPEPRRQEAILNRPFTLTQEFATKSKPGIQYRQGILTKAGLIEFEHKLPDNVSSFADPDQNSFAIENLELNQGVVVPE